MDTHKPFVSALELIKTVVEVAQEVMTYELFLKWLQALRCGLQVLPVRFVMYAVLAWKLITVAVVVLAQPCCKVMAVIIFVSIYFHPECVDLSRYLLPMTTPPQPGDEQRPAGTQQQVINRLDSS